MEVGLCHNDVDGHPHINYPHALQTHSMSDSIKCFYSDKPAAALGAVTSLLELEGTGLLHGVRDSPVGSHVRGDRLC